MRTTGCGVPVVIEPHRVPEFVRECDARTLVIDKVEREPGFGSTSLRRRVSLTPACCDTAYSVGIVTHKGHDVGCVPVTEVVNPVQVTVLWLHQAIQIHRTCQKASFRSSLLVIRHQRQYQIQAL